MMMSPVESRHCCCCFLLYSSLFRCVGMWQQWKFPPGIAAADRHDLVLLRVTIATIDLAAAAVAHHDPVLHRVTVATSDPAHVISIAAVADHDLVLLRVTIAKSKLHRIPPGIAAADAERPVAAALACHDLAFEDEALAARRLRLPPGAAAAVDLPARQAADAVSRCPLSAEPNVPPETVTQASYPADAVSPAVAYTFPPAVAAPSTLVDVQAAAVSRTTFAHIPPGMNADAEAAALGA